MGIDVDDKKNLDALSKRQREVWELLEQGQSRKQIAEKLGISYNAVTEHIRHAERRFREYEQYCAAVERSKEPAFLPLTRGEVSIIIQALEVYGKELEAGIVHRVDSDWSGKLPYKAKAAAAIYDKAQAALYGKPVLPLIPTLD